MNNQQYLKALKKALNPLSRAEKSDIVREINSYTEDSDAPLIDRFGDPKELAAQYMDGSRPVIPVAEKAIRFGKKIIIGFCLLLVALIALVAVIFSFFTKDQFNYADTSATELNINSGGWVKESVYGSMTLDIEQTKIAIYSSEDNTFAWNCKGDGSSAPTNNTFTAKQKSCLVYLPQGAHSINANQSSVVIVEPKAGLSIKARQTEIKMAEGGNTYRYNITADRAKVKLDLVSDENSPITIDIDVYEGWVGRYSY
jgi:hypothetical protein